MSSGASRPDSPIPDLDLQVGDWSGSEKDLASKPIEITRGVETQGFGSATAERAGPVDPAHDVKNEAAENVKMGGTASEDHPRNSVRARRRRRQRPVVSRSVADTIFA